VVNSKAMPFFKKIEATMIERLIRAKRCLQEERELYDKIKPELGPPDV
jgi:hypothetical protein